MQEDAMADEIFTYIGEQAHSLGITADDLVISIVQLDYGMKVPRHVY